MQVSNDVELSGESPELVIVDDAPKVSDIMAKNVFQPQRLDGETFEEYKERRLVAKYKNHLNAKGQMIWDSAKQGTYRKAVAL